MSLLPGDSKNQLGQMELPIGRVLERDRNFSKGGRSFYFFDLDDNVVTLMTPMILFRKKNAPSSLPFEVSLSSFEFSQQSAHIGKTGPYRHYELVYEDGGSFRHFRDDEAIGMGHFYRQPFVKDFSEALEKPTHMWKGPSWNCFYHAVYNGRPISLITARGHEPKTIQAGIELLKSQGFIPRAPNYLSIYPVNHPLVREKLEASSGEQTVPALKRAAIRASVYKAIETYGESPYHRFGMSDDDLKNIDLIVEEMGALKKEFPRMSFFVIDTHQGRFVKTEVFVDSVKKQTVPYADQLSLL